MHTKKCVTLWCLSMCSGVVAGVPEDAASTCKLAWAVYRGVMHALPASARAWFGDLRDRGLSASIEVSRKFTETMIWKHVGHASLSFCCLHLNSLEGWQTSSSDPRALPLSAYVTGQQLNSLLPVKTPLTCIQHTLCSCVSAHATSCPSDLFLCIGAHF